MNKPFFSKFLFIGILFIFIFLLANRPIVAGAAKQVEIYFFYGQGCPHCAAQEKFLNDLKNQYPSVKVISYEVYGNQTNRALFQALAQAYGKKIEGVPTLFIADQIFVGHSADIELAIRDKVKYCLQNDCPSPLTKLDQSVVDNNQPVSDQSRNQKIGWWILGGIGIVVVGFLAWTFRPSKK